MSQSDLHQQMLKEILAFTYDLGTSSTDEGEKQMSVYLYVYLLCTAVALRGVVRGDQGITITATCSKNHFQRKCWAKSQTPFSFLFSSKKTIEG